MTRRTLTWSAVVLTAVVSLALGIFGLSGVRTVNVSGEDIQRRIDLQLPKESKGVKLTKATVDLGESDVRIAISLQGKALGQPFSLEATGVGVPTYRPEEQAFYFRPSKLVVSKLELSGESATDRVGKFTDRYITDPKLKERIEKSLPGVKRWVEDNLEPRALAMFGEMPLYKPKNDMKGIVIKATLESLKVENGMLVLSFSLMQLTKTVLLCLFALLAALGFTVALIRNPEWGVPLLLIPPLE
ncbi:MAG: hypothetical protein A3C93_04725 [Candidatus Lloydbacteria bacterium RIFCSPHIGHO2_02_FULL_54_17]|uniref:Uncharacterized protein n=1 Tax=Candidatus Lloydbacteria bacterium RIFCSPHIGHO2_02_FULL_54_17 TaxID=1798664 RepID=A0A1G2DFM9_9BACT|nr:MAG: hypothetical protein A2762_01630 [Candidatus Lloydbacteria bacterium RIFCSPHIGHO2_01_FULL_54_11]OGZ12454.1 MAG: hypothetical protein A3C93_04725 [Candidatus Lloydbacteria bacterium RIFCSPHIGHO2_02_FULL_54_17]OGZ14713.1 MAG: hypothetical protein A2948_04405 [Candidatus Lloydbacteria bacterium RIFCSPLOWO2_01_FULL_54_18]OGZ16740.1 MAG: hypothetical protein A3H76_02305 [Candidatus Lloydbacteria bacterium RIFCSPLOWO2_02_FULL_54_12]